MFYIIYFFTSFFLIAASEYYFSKGFIINGCKKLFSENSKVRVLRPKNSALILEIIAGGIMGSSIFEKIFKDTKDNIYLFSALICDIILIEIASRIKERN